MNSSSSFQGAGLEWYKNVGTQANLESATPHRLIQMLMGAALEKIHLAKGHMMRAETALKCSHVSWAISIIDGLQMSLNVESGNDIAENMDALYHYMKRRLMEANEIDSIEILEEVAGLIVEVKSAWDVVPDLLCQSSLIPETV